MRLPAAAPPVLRHALNDRCLAQHHGFGPLYHGVHAFLSPWHMQAAPMPETPLPGLQTDSTGVPDMRRTLYMDVRPAGPRLRSSPSSCARDLLGFALGALGAAGGGLAPGTALLRPGVSGLGITWLCASADVLQAPKALSALKLRLCIICTP